MKGLRTLSVAAAATPAVPFFIHSILTPYLATHGIAVSPQGETWLVGLTMGAAMFAMRFLTSTPVGQKPVPQPPPIP